MISALQSLTMIIPYQALAFNCTDAKNAVPFSNDTAILHILFSVISGQNTGSALKRW